MKSPLVRFFSLFVLPHWPLALGVILAGLGASAATLPFPILLRQVIDTVVPKGAGNALLFYGLVLLGLVLVESLLTYLAQALTVRGGEAVVYDAQRALASHVLSLPHHFFQEHTTGYLLQRIRGDTAVAKDFFFNLIDMAQNLVFLLAGVVILFWLDWRLALAAMALLPSLGLVSKRMNAKMALLSRDIQEGEAKASQELGEALSGALHTRLLGIHTWLMARISSALDFVRQARTRTNVYGAKAGGALTFATSLGPVIFLVLGAHLVLQGKTTLGTLVAFMTFLRFLYGPTQQLILTRLNLERSKVAAARVCELLDHAPESRGGKPLSCPHPSLMVKDVSFTYPNGRKALHKVSMEARPGEWVALAGAVGSGKSTLLALIVRLFPFEEGQILLDGQDVRELSLSELRSAVLLVPQEGFLFSGSIWENLVLGDERISEEEVWRVCRALGIEEFLRELSEGIHAVVGERGTKLSGGQRQLLALARAVLRRPKVLLLDEATSAMDAEAEARAFAALRELLPESTVILAAHRLSTVLAAERIFVLREGRVVQAGRYEELLQVPGEFHELFSQQLALEAQK